MDRRVTISIHSQRHACVLRALPAAQHLTRDKMHHSFSHTHALDDHTIQFLLKDSSLILIITQNDIHYLLVSLHVQAILALADRLTSSSIIAYERASPT